MSRKLDIIPTCFLFMSMHSLTRGKDTRANDPMLNGMRMTCTSCFPSFAGSTEVATSTPLPSAKFNTKGIIIIAERLVNTVKKRAVAVLPYAAAVNVTQLESVVGAQLMMMKPRERSAGRPVR